MAKPIVDTSWFKRSCKEVPAASKGKLNTDVDEGLSGELVGGNRVPIVSIDINLLWSNTPQILNYWFLDGKVGGTDVQKRKVREAIDEWTWYANVEFKEASTAAGSHIRIQFDPEDGSWSYVGRQSEKIAVTQATMNLAWLDRSSPLTANERGIILHEFGHALGLIHEHQSPAHGGVSIRNAQAAIDLYQKTPGWSSQQIYDRVIQTYARSDISNFSQVDTRSIMHCPQPKELTGLAFDVPHNIELTQLDRAFVILHYPRKKMHPKAQSAGWTFEMALKVLDAPEKTRTQVLGLLQSDRNKSTGEISPVKVRKTIADWTRRVQSTSGALSSLVTPIDLSEPTPGVGHQDQTCTAAQDGQKSLLSS